MARMWRSWNILYTIGGNANGAASTENSMEFPQNIKNKASI